MPNWTSNEVRFKSRINSKKQLTKLKIYAGNDHPHGVQQPTIIDLRKLNQKNLIRN